MYGKKDSGYVLVTVLLMLLVLTVIGLAALGTSTVENLLSGNIRLRESNLSQADGCVEISTALIERISRMQDTSGFSNIVTDSTLATSLRGLEFDPDGYTDVVCDAAGQSIRVDIDKMYSQMIFGSASEMLSGYEGLGKGAANSFYSFYRVNSSSAGIAGSSAMVGTIYRNMPKQ